MSAKRPKLLGWRTWSSDPNATIERTTGGGGAQALVLSNLGAKRFPSGDGASDTSDAIYLLEQEIQNTHASLAAVTVTIDGDGYVTLTADTGEEVTITWGSATAARDYLGFTGATTVFDDSGLTAPAPVGNAAHLTLGVMRDEPIDTQLAQYDRSKGGKLYVAHLGEHRDVELALRFPGWWRTTNSFLYHRLHDLFRLHILRGKSFRYYLDVAATGAFDRDSNPDGHIELVNEREQAWAVDPINPQNRVFYEGRWRFARVA